MDFQLSAGHNVEDRSFMELVTKVRGSHALYWESFDVAFFILSNFGTFAMFSFANPSAPHLNNSNTAAGENNPSGNFGLHPDNVTATVTRRKFGHKLVVAEIQIIFYILFFINYSSVWERCFFKSWLGWLFKHVALFCPTSVRLQIFAVTWMYLH